MKVMLDGQGADEVLGGYHWYLPMVARTFLRRWRFLRYARFAAEHRETLGRSPLACRDALATAVPILRGVGAGWARTGCRLAVSVMSESLRGR